MLSLRVNTGGLICVEEHTHTHTLILTDTRNKSARTHTLTHDKADHRRRSLVQFSATSASLLAHKANSRTWIHAASYGSINLVSSDATGEQTFHPALPVAFSSMQRMISLSSAIATTTTTTARATSAPHNRLIARPSHTLIAQPH